jgi:hypothetical protein
LSIEVQQKFKDDFLKAVFPPESETKVENKSAVSN